MAALETRRRIARREFLASVLRDVADGTCSVLEHDYLVLVERPHRLPRAGRQVRSSTRGPLYRDVLYAAQATAVELDGRLFHDSARSRDLDLERDLDAAADGIRTIRLGWGQVHDRPCSTAAKLGDILQRRGWGGSVTSCPRCRWDRGDS